MTIKEIIDIKKTIKDGTLVRVHYKSGKTLKDGTICEKLTTMVIRFCDYANVKGVIVKGQVNPNIVKHKNCKYLAYNKNTKNWLVALYPFHSETNKPKVKFLINKVEATREEYEKLVKPHAKTSELPVFTVKLENLISLEQA